MSDATHRFTASSSTPLSDPNELLLRLCAYFRDHADVTQTETSGRIDMPFGCAMLQAEGRCLKVTALGDDEAGLAFVKLAISEHVLSLAKPECPCLEWHGDGAAGSPLPYFRTLTVLRRSLVTPRMARVTFKGDNLGRFASGGCHLRLFLPRDQARVPQWPVMGRDGRAVWPEGENSHDARVYTLRRIDVDVGEIDIDFVLHEGTGTPGARFASDAKPGHIIGITGPGGGVLPEAQWYLFAGDETALPAIARMLESLPAEAEATVLIEVADSAEEQVLASPARLHLRWLHRNGAPAGSASLLAAAVRNLRPPEGCNVFLWAGAEHAAIAAIRSHWRNVLKLTRTQHLAVAYWRRGLSGDNARNSDS